MISLLVVHLYWEENLGLHVEQLFQDWNSSQRAIFVVNFFLNQLSRMTICFDDKNCSLLQLIMNMCCTTTVRVRKDQGNTGHAHSYPLDKRWMQWDEISICTGTSWTKFNFLASHPLPLAHQRTLWKYKIYRQKIWNLLFLLILQIPFQSHMIWRLSILTFPAILPRSLLPTTRQKGD